MSQNISSSAPQAMQQMPPPMHPQARPQQMQVGPNMPQPQMGQRQAGDPGFQQVLMGVMNQQQHRGDRSHQKKERPPAIYVANLPNNYFNLELEKLFKAKGHRPIGAHVVVDHVTQKPKNYGFVSFTTAAEAQRAMEEMNNYELHGRYLRISLQQSGEKQFDDQANLFVRSLAPEVTQQDFYNFFQTYGKIRSCKVETFADGKSRCFGFVSFETAESANQALAQYNENKATFSLAGKQFEVFLHQPKAARRSEGASDNKFTNLFVKNFPVGTTDEQLRSMFAAHGEIMSAQVQRDKATNELKDSGFVCFKNPEDAEKALNLMNKTRLGEGSFLLVSQHISKRENELIHNSKQPAPIQQNLTKNFDSNLFIKNLPADLTEEAFKQTFQQYGPVVSVKFRTNPHVAQATYKQGFVLYENVDHAKLAIKNLDQMSPFGNRPISVDFWVSKQELENERHAREQNEMMNWIRHSEEMRNKPEGFDQMGGMGGFGGAGHGMQQQQYQQQRFNKNQGYNQQRGGRQNYRGGSNRGGHPGGGRPQPQRIGQNPQMPHPQQPIMNPASFPPATTATMPPNPQTFAAQPQPVATPQIQQIRFPEVNIQELHAMTDRSEKLKFVGNAIYFPIHDVHGEMAGKITGCLLDGVAEFERLVSEPEFLNRNVHDVYCLLMQQQQAAQVMQQQMTQVPTDMGGMPQPTPQVPDMPPPQQ